MSSFVAANLIVAGFVTYPSFGDTGITIPRAAESNPRIEMTTDKGPIVEMLVRCPRGVSIISYSKIERVYCTPKLDCRRDLAAVVAKSCG